MTGNFQLGVHLFLQLTVILGACRLTGRLLRPLGQTQVVSEMVAGVLIGPSLFGWLAPELQAGLFPRNESMSILYALSQVGLTLYMFIIGLELNRKLLQQHSSEALAITLAGIGAPLLLGGALGWTLADRPQLFALNVERWQAALFLAAAVSITAFPMLARILYESGMAQTRIGTLTLSAAALNDTAAWAFLATVLATIKGDPGIALLAIGGGIGYAVVMVFLGRCCFHWFARVTERDDGVRADTMARLMLVLMASAWLTDWLGIYSVFGAFICGAVMPRGRFQQEVVVALEPLTVSLLLPTFFVYSGLNTRLNLLVDPALLGVALLVLLVAFACKGGGCLLAARATGASWRESAAVGALMNARGLMELILVNIALEKELITPALFTVLVVMAVVTTLMASPLFRWLNIARESS